MPVTDCLLMADGLYVSLDGLPILRNVHIDVHRSEVVALVGGNGSGKTTLIRAAMGLIPHQEGTVHIFDTPLGQFHDWHRVGYVPQHSALNVNHATVREVVNSGRLAHVKPFQPFGRRDREAVMDALTQVELAERAHWPFHSLSGGQKQRTLIARALATGPDLLIMDEPFAGVDIHSQEGLAELLDELRHGGLGMAVVLHETGPMQPLVDRTVTLCDGRVVDEEVPSGGHEDPPPDQPSLTGLTDPVARRTA